MRAALLAVALLLVAAAPASAAPELVKLGDFTDPVHVASPPGDPRVFVVEQAGTIDIVGGGTFLDISGNVQTSLEQGLLSMAFSPDYATSGRFFVFLTSRPNGNVEVLEYRRSATDPNRADPNTRRELFTTPHAADNHNGGQLQIGPDGALYASIGDNAVEANAQNSSNPFGKIHRIDPNTRATQIWSLGLRNPWRFSFDRGSGDIVIGDVGGSAFEEINWSRAPNAGQGVNYGWPCNEGPDGADSCGQRATLFHPNGPFCAIVGGYVVRDPGLPTLNGRYLYGDNCNRRLYSATLGQGGGSETNLEVAELSSFGEDSCGHIYVAARGADAVYRLQDGAPSACPTAGPGGDTAAPALNVRILRPALKRRLLRFAVRCNEACRVSVASRLRRVRSFRPRQRSVAANTRRVVRVKLTRRIARKLRRTVRRRGFVRVVVTVRATDAAGNQRAVTKRGRIKR
jgi:hypothetical protein